MGKAELEALRNAVLALSVQERVELARDLMASVEGCYDKDIAVAWDIEICRRVDDLETGKTELLDASEVSKRIRARFTN